MEILIQKLKTKEAQKAIQNLKGFKVPGYDLITKKVLKELPQKALRFITILLNAILRLEYFPAQWKVTQIILISKSGKEPEEIKSYRPVSLLPILSKVFETHLKKN